MLPLCTPDQMRELDRATIEDYGLPGLVLMENAGRAMAEAIIDRLEEVDGARTVIVCGRGNNGGDGFVIGRWLARLGAEVVFFVLSDLDRIEGDAAINLQVVLNLDMDVVETTDEEAMDLLTQEIENADLVIDAMLGTGLNSDLRGDYARVVGIINDSPALVAAVDIPTGLNGTTGQVMGCCVAADLTVTFGLTKMGQAIHPGLDLCGDLVTVDICLAEEAFASQAWDVFEAEAIDVAMAWPELPSDGHKGLAGHSLIAAGSPGKTGAACLAAEAAVRSGSGLVTVACPAGVHDILEIKLTEAMTSPLADDQAGCLAASARTALAELLKGKDALAVGPGLGQSPETGELLTWLLESYDGPMVVDADGLNLLAAAQFDLSQAAGEIILTPHPGEMSRLTGLTAAEIQVDRIGQARRWARQWDAVVVLKGARTVTASPDGTVIVNPTGNSGLASGGSGDVLTGLITGLLAQGLDGFTAAWLGAYVHGAAADQLLDEFGARGFTASELAETIPLAAAALLDPEFEPDHSHEH